MDDLLSPLSSLSLVKTGRRRRKSERKGSAAKEEGRGEKGTRTKALTH
jgi:hypothetical protein